MLLLEVDYISYVPVLRPRLRFRSTSISSLSLLHSLCACLSAGTQTADCPTVLNFMLMLSVGVFLSQFFSKAACFSLLFVFQASLFQFYGLIFLFQNVSPSCQHRARPASPAFSAILTQILPTPVLTALLLPRSQKH